MPWEQTYMVNASATLKETQPPEAGARPVVQVLLVDHDATALGVLRKALQRRRERVVVETCRSVRAALDRIAQVCYDVVVSDIRLPGMDGLAHLARSRRLRPHTPTLLVTWQDPRDLAAQALRGGAYDFIQKPINPESFLAAVGRALQLRRLDRQVEDQKQELERRARTLEQTVTDLQESEARLRCVAQSATDAIISADDQGNIIFWNRAACCIFGYTEAQVLGRPLTLLMPERYRAAHRNGLERLRSRGEPKLLGKTVELQGLRKDGSEFPLELSLAGWQTKEGNFYTGIARDISERKETEAVRRHLAAIVESSDDAIIGTTLQGLVTSWNKGAERLYGYTPREMVGRPISLLVPSERLNEVPQLLRRIQRSEHVEHYETVRRRADDRLIDISFTMSPLRALDGSITGASSIERDITPHKQAEREILRLNDELRRRAVEAEAANKELEAFSYTVSHDLRAPLRAIDGFARILLEDHAPRFAPDARRYLDLVRNNAQQMGHLIDDLLAFSRLSRQPLRKQPVALPELVQRVFDDLSREEPARKVTLALGDLPACQADPALLKQVFVNLLANALKYSRRRAEAVIEIGCRQEPGEHAYYVKDNGVGFDMQYAHKLFGVFQRLHRAEDYEGTGVGLATVQRIIHRHGGRIWAEAAVDQGATFYFTLEQEQSHD
jgi:PAS domain S-box-containing protein